MAGRRSSSAVLSRGARSMWFGAG